MDHGLDTAGDLLRFVGFTAVLVGIAWVLQVLGVGKDASAMAQMMWILGAAAIAGAGVGSIYAGATLPSRDVADHA